MNTNKHLRQLVLAAIFAAAVTVTTAYILHIPIPTGGYIHVGDAIIYLAAALLPLPWACGAAAIGGALADLLTAPMWALPTLIIKAIICLPFTAKSEKVVCTRNLIAMVVSGILSPALYGVVNIIFTGTAEAFIPQFLGTMVQSIGSAVVFVILALAVDKAGLKKKLLAA